MNTHSKTFRIYSYHCNREGQIRLAAIARLLQEMAWEHAEKLGVGYHSLIDEKFIWVLYGLRLEIADYPVWNDVVRIKTWGKRFEKLFALRDFFLYPENSDIPSIKASSSWLVVNDSSHRPVRLTNELMNFPKWNEDAIQTLPAGFQNPDHFDKLVRRKVVYGDIDINNHVNNTSYLQFCMDAISELQSEKNKITLFDTRFVHEARLDDEINIQYTKSSDGYNVSGSNSKSSKEIFRSLIHCHPTS